MVAARIRSMARPHWLALYGGILVAWGALYVMALPADLREAGAIYGAEFLRSLCVVSPDAAGLRPRRHVASDERGHDGAHGAAGLRHL
jgi:hypothetical protein